MPEAKDILIKSRKDKGMTQEEMASRLGLSPRMYQRYEEGLFPKYKTEVIQNIDQILGTNLYDIIYDKNVPREKSEAINNSTKAKKVDINNEVRPVHYDAFMETPYVPRTAYAGYLRGHSDPAFIETLPTMLVPKEFDKGHYMVFEVSGNSMDDGTQRALMDGDKILTKELDRMHWKNKLYYNRNIFVIADKDGVVVKQITAHNVDTGIITCHSWNDEYEDYQVKIKNVQKLFYVKKIVERKITF